MAKRKRKTKAPTITQQLVAAVREAEKDPAGFSMRALTRRAGLTTGALSRLMDGQRIPRADTADKIASALRLKFVLLPQD